MMNLKELLDKNGHKLVKHDNCVAGHNYESVFNYSERHGGTVDSFKYYNDYVVDVTKEYYEDTIFDMEIPIDKNSKEFDLSLLDELKQLKDIPVNKFDSLVRKIMRKKSSCKLWFDNKTVTERWDGKEMRKTNYRCCPTSRKAYSCFCLMLDRRAERITVLDGFLSAW